MRVSTASSARSGIEGLSRMFEEARGTPIQGSRRSPWEAGWCSDLANPDHR